MNYFMGVGRIIKDPAKLQELEKTRHYVVEPKLDGIWVSVHTDDTGKISKIISRYGKEKTTKGFDYFLNKNIGLPNSILIGELITKKNELHIFDIAQFKQRETLNKSNETRRKLLERLKIYRDKITLVPRFKDNFFQRYQAVKNAGGEGLVIKKIGRDTKYVPNSRTPDWMKIKGEITVDYIITGYEISSSKTYDGLIKALKLGIYKNGKLIDAG